MSNDDNPKKLWDGRFTEATDDFVESFTASVRFDQRMAIQDIRGSVAHATMLKEVGILTSVELDAITTGLAEIGEQITCGELCPQFSEQPQRLIQILLLAGELVQIYKISHVTNITGLALV